MRLEGLEPPTYWFVASHSIQLSYRRINLKLIKLSETLGIRTPDPLIKSQMLCQLS